MIDGKARRQTVCQFFGVFLFHSVMEEMCRCRCRCIRISGTVLIAMSLAMCHRLVIVALRIPRFSISGSVYYILIIWSQAKFRQIYPPIPRMKCVIYLSDYKYDLWLSVRGRGVFGAKHNYFSTTKFK